MTPQEAKELKVGDRVRWMEPGYVIEYGTVVSITPLTIQWPEHPMMPNPPVVHDLTDLQYVGKV